MSVLDLFCGAAGGWSLGLHRAGFTTVAACEINPWRRAVFAGHFPEAKLYGDVRELTTDRIVSDIGYLPTIIVGSPPCQDASTANSRGRGVDGARTGLFAEAIRLVREIRPNWTCFENVPGLRTRGYDWVANELEEAGYAVWPLVVGAVHAGAPHLRKRVWIVCRRIDAEPGDVSRGRLSQEYLGWHARRRESLANGIAPDVSRVGCGSAFADANHMRELQPEGREQDQRRWLGDENGEIRNTAHASRAQWWPGKNGDQGDGEESRRHGLLSAWQDWNGGPPALGGMDDGLPKGMARKCLAAYGDAVVPQITEAIGRAIIAGAPANVR